MRLLQIHSKRFRYLRTWLFLIALLVCTTLTTRAQSIEAAAQQLIDGFQIEHHLASVVAAISINGELVWEGASGEADIATHRKAKPDTPYRIASISKSMTAAAVMQLVEAGKIDLDEDIRTYLPDFPEKRWPFTVRHVLTHMSGIPHYRFMLRENRPTKHYASLADAVNVFNNRKLQFEPGTRYGYSTYGYTLLGRLIEVVSGIDYERYMREHIWQPASMMHTGLEWKAMPVEDQAALYRLTRRSTLKADKKTDLSVKFPGGGMISTAGDLVRFMHAVSSGELVAISSFKEMITPPPPHNGVPYALGFMYFENDTYGPVISNDGNQSGTNSNLLYLKDHSIIVSIITNVEGQSGKVQPFTFELAELALDHQKSLSTSN